MEYILPIVAIEAYGDYNLANYAIKGSHIKDFITGCLSYLSVLVLFVASIRDKGLAWSNTAWDGWSTLATSGVAVIFLNEQPTFQDYVGIGLTSLGLIILGFKGTRAVKGKI
jgi:multidrug transporter EmrE-like cation transporter